LIGALIATFDRSYANGASPPFASLKYVEGLDYTFGTKFVGRRSQGEFIYFTLNHNDDHVEQEEDNYFDLSCREGIIWISSCDDDVSVK